MEYQKHLTLAITTIGDLLLKNRITRDNDGSSIENVKLAIPVYQRSYKWSARNAIQLLDDIIEAKSNNKEIYRVGTLILHKDKNKEDEDQYNIVDGQQRTITFSLLLSALYELEEFAKRKSIDFLQQEIMNDQYSRRNIPNNLNAFRRRICKCVSYAIDRNENFEHIRSMHNLREYIESQCELIVVITEDLSEAFQFFDSQNSRGKALYPHDLLKAYHLREMSDLKWEEVENTVKNWEKISQSSLADFFGDLYRLKEWKNGDKADDFTEQNIYKFKGINRKSRTPYAKFYKSAYSYANFVNSTAMPFVSGMQDVNAFQLNTPIIAGKPFFEYTQHYYNIIEDIRNNNKYEGFYINDNEIVKTLDMFYRNGTGNRIARLMFDTSLLLYIDRFCPATYPSKEDLELFEQFVIYAFVWAYSLRAQYEHLGWPSAQNYILGYSPDKKNSYNIYKIISDSDTPLSLLSELEDKLSPLKLSDKDNHKKALKIPENLDKMSNGVYENYLHFFRKYNFLDIDK